MHRRTFLASLSATALSASRTNATPPLSGHELCVFTKPFNSMSFSRLADRVAAMGFDGIEAPIRKGGHIDPADVPNRLPEFAEVLKARGLRITILTSDINDPNDPESVQVLRTAAGLGIRQYRLKYFRYDETRPIDRQLVNWTKQLTDLAALNRELGITGVYQNHAGRNYFGASLWDLQRVLQDVDPTHLGVAYDIRHATVEGGTSWPVTFRMIRPHIQAVYVKDFIWNGSRLRNVPLGGGRVAGKEFLRLLRRSGFDGPISLHEEYLDHRKPELVPQHLAAIQRDLKTLKEMLRQSS